MKEKRCLTPILKKKPISPEKQEMNSPNSLASKETAESILTITPDPKIGEPLLKIESSEQIKHYLTHDSQMQVE
jgi:hypothetical protein